MGAVGKEAARDQNRCGQTSGAIEVREELTYGIWKKKGQPALQCQQGRVTLEDTRRPDVFTQGKKEGKKDLHKGRARPRERLRKQYFFFLQRKPKGVVDERDGGRNVGAVTFLGGSLSLSPRPLSACWSFLPCFSFSRVTPLHDFF